jgi:hypothetical protein
MISLPFDIITVIASYCTHDDFHYLLNTNKSSFQQIKKRLIVLNLSFTNSLKYLTDISFRKRVLSVVENGWKQVNVYVDQGDRWNHSNLPSDVPVHALFVRPWRTATLYIIFCSEKRPALKAAHPNATLEEIGRMLGKIWSQMDDKAKAVSIIKFLSIATSLILLSIMILMLSLSKIQILGLRAPFV